MEMHQIRYFLAVAKTLNFTHAADECHVAQPSLSRAVQKLEAELGGELFRRERGLTHLTELGRLMLPLLTQCYESALEAKKLAVSFKKGGTPPLRLALSHTVALQLLIQPLTELVRAFPGLELQFFRGTANEVGAQLKSGDAEVAVACPLSESWDRLESWVLFSENFGLVVYHAHPLASCNIVDLELLRGVRLLPRIYCEHTEALDRILEAHGIKKAAMDKIASDHDLSALLGADVGVSIMPASSHHGENLRFVPVQGLELIRPVVLYAVAGRQRSQAATGLLRLLRSANWNKVREPYYRTSEARPEPTQSPTAA